MLARYWQAALIAALTTLFGNVVWAQTPTTPKNGCIGLNPLVLRLGKCCCVKMTCSMEDCCKDGKCCKDSNCCKPAESCGTKCTCDKNCTHSTKAKCDCNKGGECCCKDGECSCGKSCKCKSCGKDKVSNSKTVTCPFMNQFAKKAAIIMVMPSPLPMIGQPCMEAVEWRSPLPAQPHVMLPTPLPPPPPMLTPPGFPVPTLSAPVMPPQSVAFPATPAPICCPCPPAATYCPYPTAIAAAPAAPSKTSAAADTCLQIMGLASELTSLMHPPSVPSLCESVAGIVTELCPLMCSQSSPSCVTQCTPCDTSCGICMGPLQQTSPACHSNWAFCDRVVATGQPTVGYCGVVSSATLANVHIVAMPSSEELEMKVGGTCITCIRSKKMSIKIGENEIALSRFDDRVRVRGDELKATARSVASDSTERLILEGEVELHYKKDGHSAKVTGDWIELNLRSGSVTLRGMKTLSHPAVHIESIDSNEK